MQSTVEKKNDLIIITFPDFIDENEAQLVADMVEKILVDAEKISLMFCLNSYKGSTVRARFIFGEYLRDLKDQIGKIALVSRRKDKYFEKAAKVVLTMGGFKEANFFTSKKKAQSWLQL